MKAWLRKHDRKIWWGALIASVVYGQIHGPACSYGKYSWQLWLPLVILSLIFIVLWARLMRAIDKDRK